MQQNYEPNADRIIALYQQLEDDILSAIVRRMLKMGYVSDATKHQIEVLQTAGLLYDDIIQLIADRTDASTAQVKALFEDAGVQTVAIDNDIYEKAGEIPVDIRQDDSMKQVLEAGYKKTLGTMQNLVRTTANNAQTAFIQTCDRIYMQVASGAFSYQEAIRFALRELADTGAYITYPTGHTDRLDVAVRRCVLTGVSQTAAAVAKQQAENADCKYMELTAHSGARPEHAKWQGQLVIIKGKRTKSYIDGLKVFTLSEIGYGDGAGFKGWNCRHNWHPYYVGYSTPNYTQEELKKLDEPCIPYNGTLYTEYEISQMQRAGERKVRAWKRRCITAQEGVNSAADDVTKAAAQAEYSKSAVHLKANEEKLKDFCKQTGQDRDRFREQVYGFGRSEAQRAVQSNKKFLKFIDDNGIIDKEGFTSGYYRYLSKYPESNLNYYTIDYKLKEAGIKKGTALPSEFQRAYILPDSSSKRDPYHIMYRMKERNITDDELEMFMRESKVMFSQWNGQRKLYYSDSGAVVITRVNDEWIYKTAWSKHDLDEEAETIIEVINKYV